MKIRRYNESSESDWLAKSKQIRLIFADFIDAGAEIEDNYEHKELGIAIDIPIMDYYSSSAKKIPSYVAYTDIQEYIDYSKKLNEFYLDVQVCINRVKDEFPDISIKIEKEWLDSFYEGKIQSYFWIGFF
jgi:hypothetical protein